MKNPKMIKVGKQLKPNSKKVFKNEKAARIVKTKIDFYGARLGINVHNAYKSSLFGKKHDITVAADRTVRLKERGIECSIDQHLICIKMKPVKKKGREILYGPGGHPKPASRGHFKTGHSGSPFFGLI